MQGESEVAMDDTINRNQPDERMPEDARQHMRAAREEWRRSFQAFFPPEFIQHRRRARREMLLAWRSFIDRALERLDEKDTESQL
jgi:hypothetical protein